MKTTSVVFILCISCFAFIINSTSDISAVEEKHAISDPIQSQQYTSIDGDSRKSDAPVILVVDYGLPFPGMLADHPLYPLKRFRDRLLNYLIKDPLKRVEFTLLMSDKRYAMAKQLSEKGEYELAYETVQEAESIYNRILEELQGLKNNEQKISADMLKSIQSSGEKHKEVVKIIQTDSPDKYIISYDEIIILIDTNMRDITNKCEL